MPTKVSVLCVSSPDEDISVDWYAGTRNPATTSPSPQMAAPSRATDETRPGFLDGFTMADPLVVLRSSSTRGQMSAPYGSEREPVTDLALGS
jgi:hypothetical protein